MSEPSKLAEQPVDGKSGSTQGPKNDIPTDHLEEEEMGDANEVIVLDDPYEEEDRPDIEDKATSIFLNHKDSVYCVAFRKQRLPDGYMAFASGGGDDKAVLYHIKEETEDFRAYDLVGHKDSINCIEFSPDGSLLATGGLDGVVLIWNPEDGKQIATLSGPTDSVEWINFHSVLPAILVGDRAGFMWFFNAKTAKCAKVYSQHNGPVACGGFRPGATEIWSAGEDMTVKIWGVRTGVANITVSGLGFHENPITTGNIVPNGALIATGDEAGVVMVTAFDNGKIIGKIDAGEGSIESILFSPDGKYIAVGSMIGTATIWNSTNFEKRQTLEHPAGVTSMKFHSKNLWLLITGCADGAIRLWDIRDGKNLETYTGNEDIVTGIDIKEIEDKDTDMFIISSSDDGTVRLFTYPIPPNQNSVVPPSQ